ncbi:Glycoside hydrolase [Naviculisporaceae sp. PSN 640]
MRPATLLASLTALTAVTTAATLPRQADQEQPQRLTVYRPVHPKQPVQRDQNDVSPSSPSPSEAAKAALDAMNANFYNASAGQWSPDDAWWLSGNALQSLLDYMYKTDTRPGSDSYMDQVLDIFNAQRRPVPWWPQGDGEFRGDSTDDTAWWALAMLRLFDLTQDQTYLNISRLDEEYIAQYWTDSPCGGGVYVDIPTLTYKNAIANEQYVQLCAGLHNRIPGDSVYLEKAVRGWEWLIGSGMINEEGLFNDGLVNDRGDLCSNNGGTVWTYNQGVILGAATELYLATNDTSYLTFATKVADAVLSSNSLIQNDGILTEPCETSSKACNGDQQTFKGIFARYLGELIPVLDQTGLGKSAYRAFLETNARRAYENDRDPSTNLYDVGWNGPYVASSLAKQASILSLWVSLM